MHLSTFACPITILAFVLPVLSLPRPSILAPRDNVTNAAMLQPISINDYEAAMGLRNGSSQDLSHLDLKSNGQLIYGRPTKSGQLLLANLTLWAPPGLQIITTERFEGLTHAVDCKAGAVALTFTSQAAFDYAWKTWKWINAKPEDQFLLIANHDGCGPAHERQPYLITNVSKNNQSLTCNMTANKAPWSQVAGKYDLSFGKVSPLAESNRTLHRRDIFSDIGHGINSVGDTTAHTAQDVGNGISNTAQDVGNTIVNTAEGIANTVESTVETVGNQAINTVENAAGQIQQGIQTVAGVLQGNVDITKGIALPLNVGQSGVRTNLFTDETGTVTLDCIDCFVSGSFVLTGHISVQDFGLQSFTLDAHPQSVLAKLQFEASVTSDGSQNFFESKKEIESMGVPDAGIAVPGVFKLGVVASYEVGFEASYQGKAEVTFGFQASLADSTGITLDLQNPSASTATGFEGATFEPDFNVGELSASIAISATSAAKLSLGIELENVVTFDMDLKLKMPELTAEAKFALDDAGFCTQEPGASKTGASLSSSVDEAMDFNLVATFANQNPEPAFDFNLFKFEQPLFSQCFPIVTEFGIVADPAATTP